MKNEESVARTKTKIEQKGEIEESFQEKSSWPKISASPGLADWLIANNISLACSSYQTGQLFLIGVNELGGINIDQQYHQRAMGLASNGGSLWLGSKSEIWRLEDAFFDRIKSDAHSFDRVYVPRASYTTGSIDIHEMGLNSSGELLFVNTKFSCIATIDERHSFRPIWKPKFISGLFAEDRCHLNGLCLSDGRLSLVTAAGVSDAAGGWRDNKRRGGVIIDVETSEIVADGLSMPHSPRLVEGELFVLDSGRGYIVHIDRKTGRKERVTFANGFLRGLSVVGNYAIVGTSKPREKGFKNLQLEDSLRRKGIIPRCGISIFDLTTGALVEWLRFDSIIAEIFDVITLPGARCPISIGRATKEFESEITFLS